MTELDYAPLLAKYAGPVTTDVGIRTSAINTLFLPDIIAEVEAQVRAQIAADIEAQRAAPPFAVGDRNYNGALRVAARIARGNR